MKLLREYISQLLKEGIHPNISNMIKRAKNNNHRLAVVNKGSGNGWVTINDKDNAELGRVSWRMTKPNGRTGPCLAGSVVSHSEAELGYGPLLYDIAIEATGGLMPDREIVSGDARRVWNMYMDNRSDVQQSQLDSFTNLLTPEEEDNCDQESADDDPATMSFTNSALSKVYSKHGTPVIDRLRELGIIDEA